MALETETLGLDSASIRSLWSFYSSKSVAEEAGEEEEGAAAPTGPKRRRRTSKPRAKRYSEFSPPLAPGAIRLLLFFLDGGDKSDAEDDDPGAELLRAAGDAAAGAVLAELEALDGEEEEADESNHADESEHRGKKDSSSGGSPFPSLASAFHVTPGRHMTVFQASHPASIVPDSTSLAAAEEEEDGEEGEKEKVGGGNTAAAAGDNASSQLNTLLGAPPEGALAREIAAARDVALSVGSPPRLVAHRVFLARSGALLLTLTEGEASEEGEGDGGGKKKERQSGGRVAALRREAALRMPRASKRQPAILHVTLGRLLAPLPSAEAAARVSKAAEEAAKPFLLEAKQTQKAWVPRFLAHVVEDTFASVDGESVLLPFDEQTS